MPIKNKFVNKLHIFLTHHRKPKQAHLTNLLALLIIFASISISTTKLQAAQPTQETAAPTASTILVNEADISFEAYNINNYNYFKLRDIAFALNGSEKQFEVLWDGAADTIRLTSGKPYGPTGGELGPKGGGNKPAYPTIHKIFIDNVEASFTAYNIDGNNYFKLRDIGQALNFGIGWDSTLNTIIIDTTKGYTILWPPIVDEGIQLPTSMPVYITPNPLYNDSTGAPNDLTGSMLAQAKNNMLALLGLMYGGPDEASYETDTSGWEAAGYISLNIGEESITATESSVSVLSRSADAVQKARTGDILEIETVNSFLSLLGISNPQVIARPYEGPAKYTIIESNADPASILYNYKFNGVNVNFVSISRGREPNDEFVIISIPYFQKPEKFGDYPITVSYSEAVSSLMSAYDSLLGYRLPEELAPMFGHVELCYSEGVEYMHSFDGTKASGDIRPEYTYPCYRFYLNEGQIFYIPAISLNQLPEK
ncbi:MAG: hypothetical protein LBV08_05840 [Clostridiales bacterium]|jgi:hypothetical protein|nr:hypothetical protein [Clostridiales bacterium]